MIIMFLSKYDLAVYLAVGGTGLENNVMCVDMPCVVSIRARPD